MLKAQGGRMSKRLGEENNSSCRDLSGRRLKTIRDAESLAKYLAKEKDREKEKEEAITKKIEEGLKEIQPPKVLIDDSDYLNDHKKALEDVSTTVLDAFKKNKGKRKMEKAVEKPKKKVISFQDLDSS
jgi:hypothetical protein